MPPSPPARRQKPVRKSKRAFAKQLRDNPSPPEQILWRYINRSQLDVIFTRQKVILGWIVDFYCAQFKLAIEVDGKQHFAVDHAIADRYRDKVMAQAGILVVRVPAKLVFTDIPTVLKCIRHHIAVRTGQRSKKGQ